MREQKTSSDSKDSKSSFLHHIRSNSLALLICLIALIIWITVLLTKYFYFGYHDWDLAFFNQATWNLLHGAQFNSLFDVNFFGNHSNFIAYLCLPIYAIFPHSLTLIFLKVLSYISGGYILYLLAKNRLGITTAALVMFLYLIYPPNVFGILYEFDYESLAPVFLFGLFYFFTKNRYLPFIATALITILIKENMPLIILAFGIYAVFCKGKNKFFWSAIPILAGLISFYLLTYKIIPHFKGEDVHPYMGNYQGLGNSPFSLIWSIISNPLKIIPYIMDAERLKLLFEIFTPVCYLAAFSPHILFLTSPILLQHLLSGSHTEHEIVYQYVMSIAPFLFIATVSTLSFVHENCKKITYYILITLMTLLTMASLVGHKNDFRKRISNIAPKYLADYQWQFIKEIPVEKPVIATFQFLPTLSNRNNLYSFHKAYYSTFPEYTAIASLPISYALINFNDIWYFRDYPKEVSRRIQHFILDNDWGVVKTAEETVLFKKGEKRRLVEVTTQPISLIAPQPLVTIDNKFNLISFQTEGDSVAANSLLSMHFSWQALQDIKEFYKMTFYLTKNGKEIDKKNRDIGYKIYPTLLWKKGDIIKEEYSFFIFELAPGQYTLKANFLSVPNDKTAILSSSDLDLKQDNQFFILKQFEVDEKGNFISTP